MNDILEYLLLWDKIIVTEKSQRNFGNAGKERTPDLSYIQPQDDALAGILYTNDE